MHPFITNHFKSPVPLTPPFSYRILGHGYHDICDVGYEAVTVLLALHFLYFIDFLSIHKRLYKNTFMLKVLNDKTAAFICIFL